MYNILKENFEKIYCINLDSRPDKWKLAQAEFEKYGIGDIVERFPGTIGIKDGPSMHGCASSHINILEQCKKEKIKNVLVLEDDIEFLSYSLDYKNKINKEIKSDPAEILSAGLSQLRPHKWDILYLGYNIKLKEFCYKEILSDNLFKSTNQLTTHGIAYNESVYDIIIKDLKRNITNETNYYRVTCAIDAYLAFYLSHKINCINIFPMIAGQRENLYNDIGQKVRPQPWVRKNVLHNYMEYKRK